MVCPITLGDHNETIWDRDWHKSKRVDWYKSNFDNRTASPPHMDGSIVFARLRQRAPRSNTCLEIAWRHPSPRPKRRLDWFSRCTVPVGLVYHRPLLSPRGGFRHVQHVRPNRGPHKKGPHKRTGKFLQHSILRNIK